MVAQPRCIQIGHEAARGFETALHLVHQKEHDLLAYGELPVGKELDQQRREQRIIELGDRHRWRRGEPRAQVC